MLNSPDRRIRTRTILALVILATLPCYCIGLIMLRSANNAAQITPTATFTISPSATQPLEIPVATTAVPPTAVLTETPTPTWTPSITPTPFRFPTLTPSYTPTFTLTPTVTPTFTFTASAVPSDTPTPTEVIPSITP